MLIGVEFSTVVAAVDFDDFVVDEVGVGACEEGDNFGNFGGFGKAAFVNFGGFFGDEVGGEILIHFGVDPAGGDSVDVDIRCEFNSEVVSEINEGCLGSVISDAGWEERVDAVGAGDVDDFAASLFAHEASDDLAGKKWTDEVGSEGIFPIFDCVVGEFFVDSNAGVIDEDVNFAEGGECLLDEGFDFVFFADVGRDDGGANMIF